MSLASNVDKIAFAASFEIDKLWPEKFVGSFSVNQTTVFVGQTGNVNTLTIPHTRGVGVLPYMEFSTDNATWYNAGDMIYSAGVTLDKYFSATCYINSTSIVVIGQNFTAGSLTCYYRIRLISED